jgi:hypothetical protein
VIGYLFEERDMKNVITASLALATMLSNPAFGFGMTAGQGAHHEAITRSALGSILQKETLDSFAGKTGTAGAIGAPDINTALSSEAHCDNGDHFAIAGYPQSAAIASAALTACRTLIFAQLEQAVRDVDKLVTTNGKVVSSEFPTYISCTYIPPASGRAKCNALQSLGRAFHAAQDFYAHSNWVDRPAAGVVSVSNPPGLNNSAASSFLETSTSAFPAGLISGCFDSTSVVSESNGCNYSGLARIKHAVLNKDDVTKPRGAINDNFTRARAAAVAETSRKWTYFENRVRTVYGVARGNVMICAMKTDNADTCSQ